MMDVICLGIPDPLFGCLYYAKPPIIPRKLNVNSSSFTRSSKSVQLPGDIASNYGALPLNPRHLGVPMDPLVKLKTGRKEMDLAHTFRPAPPFGAIHH